MPTEMVPLLFALPRFVGWLAHWNEFLDDPFNKIVRPRQIYKGHTSRAFIPLGSREVLVDQDLRYKIPKTDIRREMALDLAGGGDGSMKRTNSERFEAESPTSPIKRDDTETK